MDLWFLIAITNDLLAHENINWPRASKVDADLFSDLTREIIQKRFSYLDDDQAHQVAVKVWKSIRYGK